MRFPGNYFGSHFIMGGERFDTPQPEAYLFGENADLNFLGNRPTAVSREIQYSTQNKYILEQITIIMIIINVSIENTIKAYKHMFSRKY